MYGKIICGYLETAKESLPTKEAYIAAGYKEVEIVPQPQKVIGYCHTLGWEETADAIVQVWTLMPLPDDIDEAEAYDIIFGGAE